MTVEFCRCGTSGRAGPGAHEKWIVGEKGSIAICEYNSNFAITAKSCVV